MKLFSWLLFPIALLYSWITQFRNYQFDNGSRPITNFDKVVISVGNLSVGGTGKSPLIEYLIRTLNQDFKIATVSRGYGRRTHGFRMAGTEDNALSIGDEPLQFYKKFGDEVIVAVCEERILAIPSVLLDFPETNLFLLDDAFQHRKVGRDFNIMLSDYKKPFYEDHVLPMGRLRESKKGAARADCVIITKCPHLNEKEKSIVSNKVSEFAPNTPVYFSSINYLAPLPVFEGEQRKITEDVILISGLANPSDFVSYVESSYLIHDHFQFRDHHNFRVEDFDRILKKNEDSKKELTILTTEKDMVRILSFRGHQLFKKLSTYYIPIEFSIDNKNGFEDGLLKAIKEKKNQN